MSAGANSYKTAIKGDRRDIKSIEIAHNKKEEQKRDNTCLNA